MQEVINGKEKDEILMTRLTRLKVFAEKLGAHQGRYLIESEAYLILEVYETRPRAIWRYIKFAVRRWRGKWQFNLMFTPRFWWYRHIRRFDVSRAVDLAYEQIEEKLFPSQKGGA